MAAFDYLVTAQSMRRMCGNNASPGAAWDVQQQQMVETLERHYEAELQRISPHWTCAGDNPLQPPVDVAEAVGVPSAVLGAILAGKCRDQRIPVNLERQKRFAEWMNLHCTSQWFTLNDSGVGPECAKGVVLVLALNERFTSLNLACNMLGDAGAAVIARVLLEHQTLVHMDLSANDIGHQGANALFEALVANRSVTSVDLSSRPGSLRNRLAGHNAPGLERLLSENPVLARLTLQGTGMGSEAGRGLARGLGGNSTLTALDLTGNDLGPKGAAALAEALLSCALEELCLADNKMGDEGLTELARSLGAPPSEAHAAGIPTAEAAVTALGSAVAAADSEMAAKYHESLSLARRSILELNPMVLTTKDAEVRREALDKVRVTVAQLSASIQRTIVLPRLRVLSLANNGGTVVGIGRVEDALQVNQKLERLVLDQSDHRQSDVGARSLVGALPVNFSLKHLSLAQCRLGTTGVLELAKALMLNQALESLSLRGNEFGQSAALALAGVLCAGAKALRCLNVSSCHLADEAGIAIASGLAKNTSLEALQLRDNVLREGAGRALVDALRKHPALTQLSLDLNSLDFRFIAHVNHLLERNCRTREKAKPQQYRQRISQLEECQREVRVLTSTLERNTKRKRRMKLKQAAALQKLKDVREEERQKLRTLEVHLQEVRHDRRQVDDELTTLQMKLQAVTSDGEYEASQLNGRISVIQERIAKHERHIELTRHKLEQFETHAGEELAAAREELEKAEKARNSAALLAAAVQRNIDNFTASLKSIEEDVSGAADPRHRRVTPRRVGEETKGRRRGLSAGPGGGGRPRPRPRTPNSTAAVPPSQPQSPRQRSLAAFVVGGGTAIADAAGPARKAVPASTEGPGGAAAAASGPSDNTGAGSAALLRGRRESPSRTARRQASAPSGSAVESGEGLVAAAPAEAAGTGGPQAANAPTPRRGPSAPAAAPAAAAGGDGHASPRRRGSPEGHSPPGRAGEGRVSPPRRARSRGGSAQAGAATTVARPKALPPRALAAS